jgi:hypothetical protein
VFFLSFPTIPFIGSVDLVRNEIWNKHRLCFAILEGHAHKNLIKYRVSFAMREEAGTNLIAVMDVQDKPKYVDLLYRMTPNPNQSTNVMLVIRFSPALSKPHVNKKK